MKKIVFLFLYFCCQQAIFAQNCGTDEMHAKKMANDANYAQNYIQTQAFFESAVSYQNLQNQQNTNQRKANVNACDSTYTVPVVVHIIHTGQVVGTGYNVSDATIQNAITYLNQVYQNAVISNGTYPSVNIGIQFALAKRDPNDAPTTGILRIDASALSAYVSNGVNLNGTSGISDATLKALSFWNPQLYYNIWVVNGIDGLPTVWGGFATFPANPPSNTDGTVIAYNALTNSLAHEIGHSLNLFHTFQGSSGATCAPNANCSADGDKICDTEPHLQSECSATSTCTALSIANTVKNYMSYCSNRDRFTPNQRTRMRNALIYLRPYFLFSEKLVPTGQAIEAGITDLLSPDGVLCSNSAPIIVVKNYGTNNLTNLILNVYVDGVLKNSPNLSLNLAQNQLDTITLAALTTTTGTHQLRIEIADINGGGVDNYADNNQICTQVTFNPIRDVFPYCNDFDAGGKPTTWSYLNGNLIDTLTIPACTLHNKALRIQNFATTSSAERAIYSDEIDLTNTSFARLTFDIAHRKPYFCNQQAILKVEVSSDCGLTYTNLYHKNSSYVTTNVNCGVAATPKPLHTVAPPPNNNSDYIPANDNEWRKDTVDLSAFIGQKVRIRFSETLNSGTGQSLYLDNICVAACALLVDINTTDLTCNAQNGLVDGTATAVVTGSTGAVSYLWSNLHTTSTISNLASGSYSCLVTDALGCQASAIGVVMQPPAFFANLLVTSADTIICQGDTVKFSAATAAGYTYTWYQNNLVISGATTSTFGAVLNGVYKVIVSNFNNCRDTSVQINAVVNPLPTANVSNVGSLTFCQGGSVVLNANTGTGLTYQWKNGGNNIAGAISASYTATTSGSYTVLITNTNNCQKLSSPKIVTVNPSPVASISAASSQIFCQGDSVILNGLAATGLTYQWQNNNVNISGANLNYYAATQTGNYRLIVTNSGNCKDTSNVLPTVVQPLPTATITNTGSLVFCQGGSVVLNANTGTGLTYQWQNGGNNIVGATSASYTATTSGIYKVLVTDLNNCQNLSGLKSVTTIQTPVASISAASSQTFCQGDSVILNGIATSSSIYQWQNNNVNISGATTNNYTTTQSGNYQLIVTSANNCKDTSNVLVVVANPLPTSTIITIGSLTFCDGSSVTLHANTGTGLIYQWLIGGNNILGAVSSSYTANVSGVYSVLVTDANNCQKMSNSLTAVENPNPVANVSATGPLAFCQGDSIFLVGPSTAGLTYQWQNNNVNIVGANSNIYEVNQSGNYQLIITNSSNCKDTSALFTVDVTPLPTPTISYLGGANLTTQNYINYQWFLNGNAIIGATSQNYTATGVGGNYAVQVNNANGCVGISPIYTLVIDNIEQGKFIPFSVYPNPMKDKFWLHYPEIEEYLTLNIKNTLGQIVHYQSINKEISEIDMSIYSNGVYFVELKDSKNIWLGTLKMVKE